MADPAPAAADADPFGEDLGFTAGDAPFAKLASFTADDDDEEEPAAEAPPAPEPPKAPEEPPKEPEQLLASVALEPPPTAWESSCPGLRAPRFAFVFSRRISLTS